MSIKSRILRTTYWINDFFKGSPVRSQYNDIRRVQEDHTVGQLLRKQWLSGILCHAVAHSAYYRGISPDSLSNFPVVNKSILKENYDRVKVPEKEIPGQEGAVHVQHTSGSTGTPFHVPQDTRKRHRRVAELKYFGKIVGFKSHEKLVHLRIWTRWQNKSKAQSFKENIIAFDMSNLGEEKLAELCTIINKEKAVCLRGYASSFDILARYVKENHISLPSLSIIIAGSEALQEGTREAVKKYIGCDIISQYANEENGILAQESTEPGAEGFYLNHAGYVFEILKMDSDEAAGYGELGRIVITDLFNYAFPMIRYDTGDLGIMAAPNAYSYGYPYMPKLYGRRFDLVYTTRGEPVFPNFGRILKNYSEIEQWQFIQRGQKEYVLKIVPRVGKLISSNEKEIVSELKEMFFGLDAVISFEYVEEIPVLNSGKRKSVVNEMK